MMKRRDFITLLGGAAAAWPIVAGAQQVDRARRLGFLGAATSSVGGPWLSALVQRLAELGWVEGRNLQIDVRWAEGRNDRATEIAVEFARADLDLIVTWATGPALAAKRATAVIPIVFPTGGDPISGGLVASLARPGGNVTGISNLSTDLNAKRLELLREIVPSLKQLAVLMNANYSIRERELAEVDAAARALGIEVLPSVVRGSEDIMLAFESLKGRAQALYIIGDPLMNTHRLRINIFALAAHLPTVYSQREYVEMGGLLSYGPDFPDSNRRAAEYVDKILRGAKPADLPVEQPTKFDLAINVITARALAITVPPSLLTRADEVIE